MKSMVKGCVQKPCNVLPFSSSSEKVDQEDVIIGDIIAFHPVGQFPTRGFTLVSKVLIEIFHSKAPTQNGAKRKPTAPKTAGKHDSLTTTRPCAAFSFTRQSSGGFALFHNLACHEASILSTTASLT